MPNVRISRKIRTEQGVIIRTEVLGFWFVNPEDKNKLAYIRKQLQYAQEEEPTAGWVVETQGTERAWHEWSDFAPASASSSGS